MSIADAVKRPINHANFAELHALTELHTVVEYLIKPPEDCLAQGADPEGFTNAKIPLYRRLPQSLEMLHVMRPGNQDRFRLLMVAIRQIIQHNSAYFPRLREICLEVPFEGDGTAFDMPSLQQGVEREGVRLRKLDNTG
ncbi:hypothetical protein NUU61_006609 [Penicillium alfredii]|uniref:Uncharacterized protein n=1 Tax=Penicillium alfredii TaxID=1506179 RepID=A0A9W9K3I0_9EURO|nr:uncharacterized protein NUU61_006609 [Penicillium alfredii]KAJ5091739.1 hypothetical protein NUU61_006609 [Penicillium alfredii]